MGILDKKVTDKEAAYLQVLSEMTDENQGRLPLANGETIMEIRQRQDGIQNDPQRLQAARDNYNANRQKIDQLEKGLG